jgi:hypothetical protein
LRRLNPTSSAREKVNINHIEAFEFNDDPSEVLEEAVEWASGYAQERRETFDKEYGWRSDN